MCISIRKGDFATDNKISKYVKFCTEQYFYAVIKYVQSKISNPQFVVFFDDVEWCKKKMKFSKETVYETENNTIWEKLRLMNSCKKIIISNSTVS